MYKSIANVKYIVLQRVLQKSDKVSANPSLCQKLNNQVDIQVWVQCYPLLQDFIKSEHESGYKMLNFASSVKKVS